MARTTGKTPSTPLLQEVSATGDGLHVPSDFFGLHHQHHAHLNAPIVSLRLRHEVERIRRDDQVASTLQQRRLAVISRDWSVTPGGEMLRDRQAAEHLSTELMRIGWDRISEQMLWGLFYGYSVAEVLWRTDGGRVGIEAIKVRDPLRFRFDAQQRLRLRDHITGDPEGALMPRAKFWTFTAGASHADQPHGRGLWYDLYWPAWFKRTGLKSWLEGLDKTARPSRVGKYPQGSAQEDIDKLLAMLSAMASDTGVAIPEGMSVELLQAARTSTADYDTLYNRMDAAISKVILSQTMTTDSSVSGLGSNQADVHADVKREVVKADVDLLNESFACSVARWLTEWNFPGAEVPVLSRQVDDPDDLNALSERDTRLAQIGFVPSEQRIKEVYGEGYERVSAASDPAQEEAGFSSAAEAPCPHCGATEFSILEDPDTVDHLVKEALEDDAWTRQMEPVLTSLAKSALATSSLEEFRDGLIARLNEMDVSELQTTLAQSSFAARIAGRLGADREQAVEVESPSSDLAEPALGPVARPRSRLKKKASSSPTSN